MDSENWVQLTFRGSFSSKSFAAVHEAFSNAHSGQKVLTKPTQTSNYISGCRKNLPVRAHHQLPKCHLRRTDQTRYHYSITFLWYDTFSCSVAAQPTLCAWPLLGNKEIHYNFVARNNAA